MAVTVGDLIRLALLEIGVARGGDVVSPDDQADALLILNAYLDALNVEGRALYASAFTTFTLTPNLQPHTIGIAANAPTFSVSVARPLAILGANLVLTGTIKSPLSLRDDAWWLNQRVPTLASSIPTDLNYGADWPNGTIRLWPVPTTAYGLELWTKTLLASVVATDTLDLPPGYQQLLYLTLAELCAPGFGQSVAASTAQQARAARARVWGANDTIPTLVTRDAGMPGGDGGGWDNRTGLVGS